MISKAVFTKGIVVILFLCFTFFSAFSQEKSVLYTGINGKITTLPNAIYMQKVSIKSPKVSKVQFYMLKDSKWEKTGSEQYKKLNDSTYQITSSDLKFHASALRRFVEQPDKLFKFTDIINGQVVRSGYATSMVPLLFHGPVTEYYEGGDKKSVSQYANNELVSNENWLKSGVKYMDNVFYSVDSFPTFNPGNKVIYNHILQVFKDAGIDVFQVSGSLIVGFVVMEDGSIDGIKIVKGIRPFLNNVALESFQTLKGTWTPAKLNNQTVRYFQTFPINFIYKEQHLEYAEFTGKILNFNY